MATKRISSLAAVLQSMGGRVGFVLLNACTGIVTARALHPAGRGELAALGVWPNFLGSLMTFGLPSSLIFWSRSDNARRSNLIWAALPLTLVLAAAAMLLGVVGIPFWLSQYPPHIVHLAQIFMVNAFTVLLAANARAACEAEGDFFASSVALCMSPLIAFFGLMVLFVLHRMDPATASVAYLVSGVPACVFLMFRLRGNFTHRPVDLMGCARDLLHYGFRSYGVDICGTLSLYADQAVVVHLLTPGAMGIYVVALSLSRVLNVIHQSVAAVLFPKAVSLEQTELLAVTGRALRISTLGTSLCGLMIAVFGPILLSVLYGREYRDATLILNILIVEVILTGATLVLTRAYMALGRPGLVTILQASGLVLSLPLLALLVPRWGVLGASIALLTAGVIRFFLAIGSFRVVLGVPAPSVIPRIAEIKAVYAQVRHAALLRLNRRSLKATEV